MLLDSSEKGKYHVNQKEQVNDLKKVLGGPALLFNEGNSPGENDANDK